MAAASVAAPLGLFVGAELVRSPAWGRALSGASMGAMAGLMGAMTLAMGDMDMGDTGMAAMPMGAATLDGHAVHPDGEESRLPIMTMSDRNGADMRHEPTTPPQLDSAAIDGGCPLSGAPPAVPAA